jgi:hypothetical protein
MSLRKLGVVVVVAVLTLLVGEATLRLLFEPPRYHSELLEFHPELGFRGVPGFRGTRSDARGAFPLALDSSGLRGSDLSDAEPTSGALRVVVLGDSFLFAPGLRDEDLMTSRSVAALAERGIRAEVANLSASDYGTGQELLLLRLLGPRLRPEVVVLVLYPGNDLANNSLALAGTTAVSVGDYIRPYVVEESGRLRVRWTHPLRSWLRRHSRLFAVAERHVLAMGAERRISWLMPWPARPGQGERLEAGAAPREALELFREPAPGSRWQTAWDDTFLLLRTLRDEVESLGARLLVLVIPTIDQVHSNAKGVALDLAIRRATGAPLSDLLEWNLPEERLSRFFESEGIEARMLLGPLREAAQSGAWIYQRDGHLALAGHELAAAVVGNWIAGDRAGPPAAAVEGRPVDRHPGGETEPATLDFRHRDHALHVGDGWLGWRRQVGEMPGGWELGRRGLLVLPDRAAPLVMRGVVLPETSLPVVLEMEVVWGPRRHVRLDLSGPFQVRLPVRPANPPGAGSHAVVQIGQRGPLQSGIVVQEVGFEPLAPRGGD